MMRDISQAYLEKLLPQIKAALESADATQIAAKAERGEDIIIELPTGEMTLTAEDVLEQLSVTRPELPVVVFTGYGDLRHRSGQVAALLPKPVRPSELLRTIRQALDQR